MTRQQPNSPMALTAAQERFLTALGEGLSVAGAAKLAGVGRQTVYDWRRRDSEFAAAWDDAIETGTDNLEDEARRRAMSTSDTLMIFMLKARRPEKFKERRASELSGPGGGPIQHQEKRNLSVLTDEELVAFAKLAAKVHGEAWPADVQPDAVERAFALMREQGETPTSD